MISAIKRTVDHLKPAWRQENGKRISMPSSNKQTNKKEIREEYPFHPKEQHGVYKLHGKYTNKHKSRVKCVHETDKKTRECIPRDGQSITEITMRLNKLLIPWLRSITHQREKLVGSKSLLRNEMGSFVPHAAPYYLLFLFYFSFCSIF